MYHSQNFLSSLLLFILLRFCVSIDTITVNQPLKDGDVLISNREIFALGFFSPNNSSRKYVGIWYYKVSERTVVWVANRDNPITNTSGVILSISRTGDLVLQSQIQELFWSTNVSEAARNCTAQLLDSGNLVLFQGDSNRGNIAWQSFDYPTDTLLSNMKLGVDRRTGLNRFLTSWKSRDDPGTGAFSYKIDINDSMPQLFLYKNSVRFWRAGPWNGIRWVGVPEMTHSFIFQVNYVENSNEVYIEYDVRNASIISRMVLNEMDGTVERLNWLEEDQKWVGFWAAPKDQCDNFAHCGNFGDCNLYNSAEFECKCLPGFEPKSVHDWYLRDGSGGCVRKQGSQVCQNGEGFVKVSGIKLPDTTKVRVDKGIEFKACEDLCLRNCSCSGYTSADISKSDGRSGCITWYGDMVDVRQFSDNGQDVYIRVDAVELAQFSRKSKRFDGRLKVIIVVISIATLLLTLIVTYWLVIKKRRGRVDRGQQALLFSPNNISISSLEGSSKGEEIKEGGASADVQFFSLGIIVAATDNFSSANKLGEGGFGSVYKGQLPNGQEMAVKRLSNSSGQGIKEFRNEVTLIAKLQHRNLVRLLGCCIQNDEKMLIYEYLPNKGLDCFIFDKTKDCTIDWRNRFDIILGIVRGMVYLHHDSRLRIIHRDLKASNVLLDASMNPKISDFGMARIFGGDQLEETTRRVVGTYGYMSPEYAMEGLFSIKSDVFSFGVLLLEIISGKKNNSYFRENSVNLIGHVWDLWREGKALEIVDPLLGESYPDGEVLRCIHIGLLCVQESATARPTMTEVGFMLCNETALPTPNQPAFILKTVPNYPVPAHTNSTSGGASTSVNDVTLSVIHAR